MKKLPLTSIISARLSSRKLFLKPDQEHSDANLLLNNRPSTLLTKFFILVPPIEDIKFF